MSALPLLLLTLATACQGGSASAKQDPGSVRKMVELRNTRGSVIASVSLGRPCRVTIGEEELIIGGRPLVMMYGETRWGGSDVDGSTVITRDGESFARIFPDQIVPDEVALFDREGIAIIRATVDGDTAIVRDRQQSPIRELHRTATTITIAMQDGNATVTGTQDLLLAAVLSATEATTEVRALAACHRLLPPQKARF